MPEPQRSAPTDAELLDDDSRLAPGDAVAAILTDPQGRYLLQLRDRKKGIFFPGRWGCFGGAIEPNGETNEQALARELKEELNLDVRPEQLEYFTNYTFDMSFCGAGVIYRKFYALRVTDAQIRALKLGEGSAFQTFSAREILTRLKLVPYDEFALWMHSTRGRLFGKRRTTEGRT